MPNNMHEFRDLVETIVTFGGAIGFVWGFIKFASKFGALKDVPEKMDTLGRKVDSMEKKIDDLGEKTEEVDHKVENLTGQFEIFKSFGMGRK